MRLFFSTSADNTKKSVPLQLSIGTLRNEFLGLTRAFKLGITVSSARLGMLHVHKKAEWLEIAGIVSYQSPTNVDAYGQSKSF